MDADAQRALDAAMTTLAERVVAEPHLQAELQRARRDFFGRRTAAGAAAERRFLEWFLLERESETLGEVPAEVARFGADDDLLGSTVGAFTVTGVASESATARDLQDDTVLEFVVPTDSLAVGDLVVGRLFAHGTGQWLPSTVASVFRPGGSLAGAFAHDVQRLDLGRRLQQIELEHVLLLPQEEAQAAEAARADAKAPPLEHLEADLDRLLRGQPREYSATAISEQLARAARPGPVLGPLLDEIAFDTAADLDAVRQVLLRIWNAHHADAAEEVASEPPAAPGETLGERMVRRLDDGLRSHRDLEGLFAELEQMAGLEPGAADDGSNPFDAADDDSAERPAGDAGADPGDGDLAPLVEEFLWETAQTEPERAERVLAHPLRTWVGLQANAAVPRVDLELVTADDLVRVLLHVFLGSAPAARAAAVRAALAALREFYDWAGRTQLLELQDPSLACQGPLLDQLDRLAGAGLALSGERASTRRPALFEVEEVAATGFGVRDDDGGGQWLDAAPATSALLRVGDLVLGALVPGAPGDARFEGPVVVLPAEARALIE